MRNTELIKRNKSIGKISSTTIILGILASSVAIIPHISFAKDKQVPQNIEIIILEDNQEKKNPVTIDLANEKPQLNYSIDVPRINGNQLANAEKSLSLSENSLFTVNRFKGYPAATFPIIVPPGTNGMSPDLSLQINELSVPNQFKNGTSISGAQIIQKCDAAAGICLGSQPLLAVKGSPKGSQYTLAIDPRLHVSSMQNGYSLSIGDGTTHIFKAVTSSQSDSGPWKISESTDWYGNFASYFYDTKAEHLTDIFYGQKDAQLENLRSVHILYDEKTGSYPTQISAMLGKRQVRSYHIRNGSNGMISSLTECATDEKEKLHCRPSATFSWTADKATKAMLLTASTNGYGGVTDVEYEDMRGGPAVSKVTVSDGKTPMEITNYQYAIPIMVNNKRVGFEKSVSVDEATKSGDYNIFGTGALAGVKLTEGMFTSSSTEPQIETSFNYERLNNDPEGSYVLSRITSKEFGANNTVADSATENRTYDDKGRVKIIVTDATTTTIAYLDEEDKNVQGDARNLVTKTTQVNNLTKQSQSEITTYTFNEGAPQKSSRTSLINGIEHAALEVEQIADQYGNLQSFRSKDGSGKIEYDEKYATFPENITTTTKDGSYVTNFSYDPISGVELGSTTPTGGLSTNKLDPFGEIIETNSIVKSPMDKDIDSKEAANINEKNEWSTDTNGNRVATATRIFSNTENGDLLEITVKSRYDGLNRVTRVDSIKKNLKTNQQVTSSMVNEYDANGQIIKITDEEGKTQETHLDAQGRPVKEIAIGYGIHEFSYDDAGNIATVTRNGQTVHHTYDEQGRLIRKTLPDNKVYEFGYDRLLSAKIANVSLPDGQRIEYTFTPRGQTASKTVFIPGPDNKNYKFTTAFTYDNTRLKTVTYPDGSVVTYDYENKWSAKSIRWTKNAPKNWLDINTPIVTYSSGESLDGDTLLLKTLGNGIVESYSWQPDGKLNEITVTKPNSKKDSKVNPIVNFQYAYDPSTQLLKSTARTDVTRNGAEEFRRLFGYDDNNNITSVAETLNGKKEEHLFSYDENNSLISDNKLTNQYTFTDKNSHTLASDTTGTIFQHDTNMNISAIAHNKETSVYKFDVENKLLSASVTSRGNQTDTTFVYDHLGERLVKKVKNGSITTYVSPFFEFNLLPDGSLQQTRYVWDSIGRVAAFTEKVPTDTFLDAIPVVPGKTDVTDRGDNGQSGIPERTTAFTKALMAVADASPRLLKDLSPLAAVFFGTVLVLSLFEKLRRLLARREEEEINITFEGGLQSGSANGSGFMRTVSAVIIICFLGTTLAPIALAALQSGDGTPKVNQTTFFHYDVRGSVVAVTDEAGNQTASVNYRPYGSIDDSVLSSGNNNFRHKFAGMEYDESTGLYYDHARYLHPGIKRFLSADISRSTVDPYSYTDGDPVNYVDPDGQMLEEAMLQSNTVPNNDDGDLSIVSVPMSDLSNNNSLLVSNIGLGTGPSYGATATTVTQPSNNIPQVDNLDWVRYPSFSNAFFWGVEEGYQAPPPIPQTEAKPTKEEAEIYNKRVHEGYTQGWTRTGGYLQSLLTSLVLARWFPTSDSYPSLDSDPLTRLTSTFTSTSSSAPTAGFWRDAAVYLMTVTAFSGYGKSYTANEAYYWQGVTKNKSATNPTTGEDYFWLSLRRVMQKTIVQVLAFSSITLLSRLARGYTVFNPNLTIPQELGWLALRNIAFASIGSIFMLAYYIPTKEPYPGYDNNLAFNNYQNSDWQQIANSWSPKNIYKRVTHSYRRFSGAKGWWAERDATGKLGRLKNWGWYAAYVTQMYAWYLWGSLGYYAGFATVAWAIPHVSRAQFFESWRSNLAQIILSPAASPLAWAVNTWARKAYTIVPKRSKLRPRTPNGSFPEWLAFRILGPIEGLRLAKYDTASYMPREDWLPELRQQNQRNSDDGGDANDSNLLSPNANAGGVETESNESSKSDSHENDDTNKNRSKNPIESDSESSD